MKRAVLVSMWAMAMAMPACGDDGSEAAATTDAGSTSEASTGATGSTTAGTTTITTSGIDTGTTEAATGSADSSTSMTTSTAGSGTETTGSGSTLILQNDGWDDGAQVGYQEGFVQSECWASVYEPPPDTGPFELEGVSMLVGGDDMGEAEFSVGLWSVDGDNQPDQELASGTTFFSGADMGFDGTTADALDIISPTFDNETFAVVVCLLAHDGFPAIGRDADGTIAEELNWIRLENGTWARSADLGLTGDWIMRATIRLQ